MEEDILYKINFISYFKRQEIKHILYILNFIKYIITWEGKDTKHFLCVFHLLVWRVSEDRVVQRAAPTCRFIFLSIIYLSVKKGVPVILLPHVPSRLYKSLIDLRESLEQQKIWRLTEENPSMGQYKWILTVCPREENTFKQTTLGHTVINPR